MNPELRKFLEAVRTIVAAIAALTPFQHDDEILKWLDFVLGNSPEVPDGAAKLSIPWDKLPWEKLLPLLLPLIQKAIERWLNSLVEKQVAKQQTVAAIRTWNS